MAAAIAAHVSVVYPEEGSVPALAPVAAVAPFHVVAGAVVVEGDGWVYLPVEDATGGFGRLREVLGFDPACEPHVTIRHPRTATGGLDVPNDLRASWVVRSVALTAWDGERWVTEDEVQLGG
jgi:hypothetical protein